MAEIGASRRTGKGEIQFLVLDERASVDVVGFSGFGC